MSACPPPTNVSILAPLILSLNISELMDGIILSDVPTIINVSCDISLNRSHVPIGIHLKIASFCFSSIFVGGRSNEANIHHKNHDFGLSMN